MCKITFFYCINCIITCFHLQRSKVKCLLWGTNADPGRIPLFVGVGFFNAYNINNSNQTLNAGYFSKV